MPTYSHRFVLEGTTQEEIIIATADRPCHARDAARNYLTSRLAGTPYMGGHWLLMAQWLST